MPNEDLRREFLPTIVETVRQDAEEYTPLLNFLTPEEVERNDREREREVRRKRRQTKGRGTTLPERDRPKTHRTLVPKSSSELVQAYQDPRGEIIRPPPEISLAFPIEPPAPLPKPANLDSPADSPLKLATLKQNLAPVASEASRPFLKPGKRLRQTTDGSFLPFDSPSGSATPADGTPTATPGPEAPGKRGRKKMKQVNPAEFGLHEHMINGKWHCANW